jgi:hypothetical protein
MSIVAFADIPKTNLLANETPLEDEATKALHAPESKKIHGEDVNFNVDGTSNPHLLGSNLINWKSGLLPHRGP